MNLYLASPLSVKNPIWQSTHILGFVVRAPDEAQARKVCFENAKSSSPDDCPHTDSLWLNPSFTTCVEIGIASVSDSRESGVVLANECNP